MSSDEISPKGCTNYIEAIYRIESETGKPIVSTKDIGLKLGVTPGSVSSMIARLNNGDLVEHTPYYGVRATETGKQVALRSIRRHRLTELMLLNSGLSWDEVHIEAVRLKHELSDEAADKIDAHLGYPIIDPHGSPIPRKESGNSTRLIVPNLQGVQLIQCEAGVTGRLSRVSAPLPEMLRFLADKDVAIDSEIHVVDVMPFGGSISLIANNQNELSVGPDLASVMFIDKQSFSS